MRLVSGPAGSGKTFRCLAEIRDLLCAEPEGLPLLLIAPKQNTYLLERQLLSQPSLSGYTRLHILSFERLAHLIFEWLGLSAPEMLSEQGRLMVMRAIIAKKRDALKLFRASARLTGFAQQLGQVIKEMQRKQLTPETLRSIAQRAQEVPGLSYKLQDLATMLEEYLVWLHTHKLQDSDSLLDKAIDALSPLGVKKKESLRREAQLDLFNSQPSKPTILFERLWVDGFAQFSEQEIGLLAALAPHGYEGTLMLCLDKMEREEVSWLSPWSLVGKTFTECRKRLIAVPGLDIITENLPRDLGRNRFAGNRVFAHLENYWEEPQPYTATTSSSQIARTNNQNSGSDDVSSHIRVVTCVNPQEESVLAAREILRFARSGGRFREATVLVRKLNEYVEPLRQVFSRFQIPFFMDQREPVSHHPLPELTRNALRTIVFGWVHDDWFAALKTGLVSADEKEIDRLENEALARGWKGNTWQKPLVIPGQPEMSEWLADWHGRVVPPFQQLALALGAAPSGPTGREFAHALRDFWGTLRIEQRLQNWTDGEPVNRNDGKAGSVHATVWEEMKGLLTNVELAFANEALPLRDWLQILEAGLGSLTVGVVPPALDQVLVGAIDRSRNPEIKLALVLGLNEGIFPARPEASVLLSEADKAELEKHGVTLRLSSRQQLGQERFLGYIGFTRASERLFLSRALQDSRGSPLNPSLFLRHLTRLFPMIQIEDKPEKLDWRGAEHPSELIGKVLSLQNERSAAQDPSVPVPTQIETIPGISAVVERLSHFRQVMSEPCLTRDLAGRLYGFKLRTSVSRLEQFAACPFKFFVHSGLKAEERQVFELDAKEQGLFQHDLLALFHEQLSSQGKRWRDISGLEARDLIAQLAESLAVTYREGLLHASERSKFMLRLMTESLQDFIETSVNWMREQYRFNPVAVEVPFGEGQTGEPWEVDLDNDHHLVLQGRIDRVDVFHDAESSAAQCVVVDYKSGQKRLDPLLLANGLQLQLLTYLNVLRRWRNPRELCGAITLAPAGVFYVNLRGQYEAERDRRAALSDINEARQIAYRHNGRFNANALRLLDSRSEARVGNQFNYRLNLDGNLSKNCREALSSEAFEALLDAIETQLKQMGQQIFSGVADVAPYKKGSVTACHQCVYGGICRIDPWTHRYRVLNRNGSL